MTGTDAGLVSGRYRLGPLLGSGGSASVFAAVDTRTGDAMALKILHPELSRSPRLREAFFREAHEAERVRHPNVVAVLDTGVHDDENDPLAWIALELAPGHTLAEHVERTGPLPVADALTLALAVLRGLAAVHGAGLIHRDVSPANIMIAPEADGFLPVAGVRLLDFGLADAAGQTATGRDVLRSEAGATPDPEAGAGAIVGVLGSVNYLSPEQAAGRPVDERGDIYQVGGVLYFALTGRPPFPRATTAAVMRAHALTPPPVPSVARPGIPRSVDRIVVRALLKDPEDRFATADQMREAILAADVSGSSRPGDDRTRRFGAAAGEVTPEPGVHAVPDDGRTTVLPRTVPVGAPRAPSMPDRRLRPPRRGRMVGRWLTPVLVLGIVAAGWVAAVGDGAGSTVAVRSTPSASASAPAEPAPTTPPAVVVVDPSIQVPDLTDLSLGQARAALEAAGLRLGAIGTRESVRAADTVLAADPGPGSWLDPGELVAVTVSSGSNTVPATVGLGQADATSSLQNAGFLTAIETRPDATAAPGTVLASMPAHDAIVRLGATVTLTVAGPVATPTSTPTPVPSPSGTPSGTPTPVPAG